MYFGILYSTKYKKKSSRNELFVVMLCNKFFLLLNFAGMSNSYNIQYRYRRYNKEHGKYTILFDVMLISEQELIACLGISKIKKKISETMCK